MRCEPSLFELLNPVNRENKQCLCIFKGKLGGRNGLKGKAMGRPDNLIAFIWIDYQSEMFAAILL